MSYSGCSDVILVSISLKSGSPVRLPWIELYATFTPFIHTWISLKCKCLDVPVVTLTLLKSLEVSTLPLLIKLSIADSALYWSGTTLLPNGGTYSLFVIEAVPKSAILELSFHTCTSDRCNEFSELSIIILLKLVLIKLYLNNSFDLIVESELKLDDVFVTLSAIILLTS